MKTMKNVTIMIISILSISILLTSGLVLPTAGLSATPSPTSSLGIFYYPWGGGNPEVSPTDTWRYWSDDSHNPPKTWASNYLPQYVPGFDPYNDLYSAKDPNVIKWQLGLMKKAGINFVISSWWGQNHYTDQTLDIIFNQVMPDPSNPYPDAKWAIYYEKEGFANVPIAEIISDINYIKNKYMSSPYYYTVDGKPVVFVYNTDGTPFGGTSAQEVQKWKDVRDQTGIYLVLKVFPGYTNYIGMSDGWHQYAPASNYDIQSNYSAFVSPGFYKWNEPIRLGRDLARFENDIIALKNANVQFKLIETWNEWGEGTGIEPAQRINHDDVNGFTPAEQSYGTAYVDIIGKYFNPDGVTVPTPIPTDSPVPTVAPTPIPTDSPAPTVAPTPVPTVPQSGNTGSATVFCYVIKKNANTPEPVPTTTPVPTPVATPTPVGNSSGNELRFIVVGDPHVKTGSVGDRGNERLAQVVNFIDQSNVDFAVFLGDITDDGQIGTFGIAKNIIANITKPYYTVAGNHDVLTGPGNFEATFGSMQHLENVKGYQLVFPGISLEGTSIIHWSFDFNTSNKSAPTLVFMHGPTVAPPIGETTCNWGPAFFGYGQSMQPELNTFSSLIAEYTGHVHYDTDQTINGVRYVTVNGLVNKAGGCANEGASNYVGYSRIKNGKADYTLVNYNNQFVDPFPGN